MKGTTLDVPRNILLHWGAAAGDLALEGDFVEQWRLAIASDFMKHSIERLAVDIKRRCKGGKYYSGLDGKNVCKGGVWIQSAHLGPSAATSKSKHDLIKGCIAFAIKALKKKSNHCWFHFSGGE